MFLLYRDLGRSGLTGSIFSPFQSLYGNMTFQPSFNPFGGFYSSFVSPFKESYYQSVPRYNNPLHELTSLFSLLLRPQTFYYPELFNSGYDLEYDFGFNSHSSSSGRSNGHNTEDRYRNSSNQYSWNRGYDSEYDNKYSSQSSQNTFKSDADRLAEEASKKKEADRPVINESQEISTIKQSLSSMTQESRNIFTDKLDKCSSKKDLLKLATQYHSDKTLGNDIATGVITGIKNHIDSKLKGRQNENNYQELYSQELKNIVGKICPNKAQGRGM